MAATCGPTTMPDVSTRHNHCLASLLADITSFAGNNATLVLNSAYGWRKPAHFDRGRRASDSLDARSAPHPYYHVDTAATAAAGLKALKEKSPSLVLLDLQLPDAEGLETLDQIKTERPETQVVILTAHDTLSNAIESIKRGAYHFISKPYAPEELLSLVDKALEKQSLLRETAELREKTQQLEKRLEVAERLWTPIFKSKAMQQIEELVNAMAPSEANVLITGESGVGKEIIANLIHSRSRRAEKAMVKLNCAAFPQTLIEGELFGYMKRVHRSDERF